MVDEAACIEAEVVRAVRELSDGLMLTDGRFPTLYILGLGSDGFAAFSKAPILYRKMILLTSVNPRWQEGLWYMGISQRPNSNGRLSSEVHSAQSEVFKVKVTRLGQDEMSLTSLRVRSLVVYA